MEKKYSRVTRLRGWRFRYNFNTCEVEALSDENEVVDSVGLRKENWVNKEARMEYLGEYVDNLEEEASYWM